MSQLQLSLLGEPIVKHGEDTLLFSTRKALALLVYLAVEGGMRTRKTLSEAFWPELDAEHGRAGLRATIFELRKLLERSHSPGEPAHLLAERETLGLAQDSSLDLDLRLVEAVSKRVGGRQGEPLADQEDAALQAQLEQATRLVRGPFLAGFTLRDSQFFDDWTRQQREYWRLRMHQLFDALSRLYEQAGDGERALETVSRWLAFDPLHEAGYRRLMRLRFSLGDRAGALRAYITCRDVLAQELELAPEPETVALAKWIRRTVPVHPAQSPAPSSSAGQSPAQLLYGLPLRSAQFSSLIECYQRVHAGQSHLVLLQGETGMGKTRLATEFLAWAQAQGAQVLAGKALHTDRPLPYQPLIAALRPRLEQEPAPDDLVSAVWLTELARLLPELRNCSPDLAIPTMDEALGHSRLFEATARLLQAWAARRPLVLWLDDLHWADTVTRDLLLYLAQRLAERPAPILLLLTLRTGAAPFADPPSSWLMALKRTGIPLTALGLAPFTPEETQRFVQALAWVQQQPEVEDNRASDGCPESEGPCTFGELLASFAHWLYEQTRGQPFYLVELLKELIEQEIVVPWLQKDGTWGLVLRSRLLVQTPTRALIPASVRELMRSHLGQLTPSAWSLLVAGAVMGEGLTFERLCQVAQLDEEPGLQALEEVLRRGWLCEAHPTEEAQAVDEYSFPGELIRAVVSQEAGTTRQRLVQRRVWAVLQEEAEHEQGEEASLPHPASLDGHAPAETRQRLAGGVAAEVVSRERRGRRLGVATASWGVTRRQAEAGRGKKTPLGAGERGGAAQAIFTFPRSPPGSAARAIWRRTKACRVRARALSATNRGGKSRWQINNRWTC